jgi:spermidine/putrescine-binding protein
MDTICIPKGAPHKDLAVKFIDYILRPEVSAKLSKAFPYGNPNTASHAVTDKKILKNPASYPSMDRLKKAEWLKDVGKFTTEYDRIWTEVKGQ